MIKFGPQATSRRGGRGSSRLFCLARSPSVGTACLRAASGTQRTTTCEAVSSTLRVLAYVSGIRRYRNQGPGTPHGQSRVSVRSLRPFYCVRVRVVLVRHCRSAVDTTTPPPTWGLTAEGHRQAAELVSSPWLATATVLAAGPEPKMVQTLHPTAERLGVDVVIDDAFRETDASWLPDGEFLSSVSRLFASRTSSPAAGWEPSRDAARRFFAGVTSISSSRSDVDVVVCSGGRVLTSLLMEVAAIDSKRAFSYWQSICMPDIAVVDLPANGAAIMRQHFADKK